MADYEMNVTGITVPKEARKPEPPKTFDLRRFRRFLKRRFGGILKEGAHPPNGQACILEAHSQFLLKDWTDEPDRLNTWDLRELNDMSVSDELRTLWMPRVLAAYYNCRNWSIRDQRTVLQNIIVLTCWHILAVSDTPQEWQREFAKVKDFEAALRLLQAADRNEPRAEYFKDFDYLNYGTEDLVVSLCVLARIATRAAAKYNQFNSKARLTTYHVFQEIVESIINNADLPVKEDGISRSLALRQRTERLFVLICKVLIEAAK